MPDRRRTALLSPLSRRAVLGGLAAGLALPGLAHATQVLPAPPLGGPQSVPPSGGARGPLDAPETPAPTPHPAGPQSAPPTAAGPEPDRLVQFYVVRHKKETLLDVARAFDLGFLEVKAANPGVDVWVPGEGTTVVLPTVRLMADSVKNGLLINLSEMRIFQFRNGSLTATHPLGIGREGLETPLGTTHVVRKVKDPVWYPTARMRREKPELPAMVPAGPDNPLGNRALYLGWDLYRIHGTNNPWGVGRRTSSGCLRMYPEDAESLYETVNSGVSVQVIRKRWVAGIVDGRVWLEAYHTDQGYDALEFNEPLPVYEVSTEVVDTISAVAGSDFKIDWDLVARVVREARGYPIAISA